MVDCSIDLLKDPLDQLMGLGTDLFDPVYLPRNGIGLEEVDPDEQCTLLKGVSEKNHRLLACGIRNESVDFYLKKFLLLKWNRRTTLCYCLSRRPDPASKANSSYGQKSYHFLLERTEESMKGQGSMLHNNP
ncbi:hypothetical protein ES703_107000 [subsurface metagenome]